MSEKSGVIVTRLNVPNKDQTRQADDSSRKPQAWVGQTWIDQHWFAGTASAAACKGSPDAPIPARGHRKQGWADQDTQTRKTKGKQTGKQNKPDEIKKMEDFEIPNYFV